VTRALTLLKEEIHRDLALLGIRSINEISSALVRRL
jgi:L-lactate dehydrogenase (cytochrome)